MGAKNIIRKEEVATREKPGLFSSKSTFENVDFQFSLDMDVGQVNRDRLEKLYKEGFQPDNYVAQYYSSLDAEVEFFLNNLHLFFDQSTRYAGTFFLPYL